MTTANVVKDIKDGAVYFSSSKGVMLAKFGGLLHCWKPFSYTGVDIPDATDWVKVSS